jgi:hypothetical protein
MSHVEKRRVEVTLGRQGYGTAKAREWYRDGLQVWKKTVHGRRHGDGHGTTSGSLPQPWKTRLGDPGGRDAPSHKSVWRRESVEDVEDPVAWRRI